jgi:hypothetical protein
MDLGVDRGAESRHRDQPSQVGQLSGGDERQQHACGRRQRGRRRATEKEQNIPAEEKGLP